jgi:hypothetical protein
MPWIEALVGILIFVVAWAIGSSVKADQLKKVCKHKWEVITAEFPAGYISPEESMELVQKANDYTGGFKSEKHPGSRFFTHADFVANVDKDRPTILYAQRCSLCGRTKACDAFTADRWKSEQKPHLQAIAEFDAAMEELNEVVIGQKT